MLVSRVFTFYLIHLALVGAVLLGTVVASVMLHQPLGIALAIFGLNALPEFQQIVGGGSDQDDTVNEEPGSEYHGSGSMGFTK